MPNIWLQLLFLLNVISLLHPGRTIYGLEYGEYYIADMQPIFERRTEISAIWADIP